jgi:large subunit ribosomal protein L15
MFSHEITSVVGKHKIRKRVGRGRGTGHGKTCGRGHKGYHSRAGSKRLTLSEGGQMPLFRRLPKRGFSNVQFAKHYDIINVSQLERFDDGAKVGLEQLVEAGLISSADTKVKVLGNGDLTKALYVNVHKFTKSAEEKITGCGGTISVIEASTPDGKIPARE